MASQCRRRPFVLVVDGVIASGKTSLVRNCLLTGLREQGLHVVEFPEPVDEWKASGRLAQFYNDPSRRAYQFQTRAFHDRIQLWCDLYEMHADKADVIVAERSIFTDVVFVESLAAQNLFDSTEREDYYRLWNMWKRLLPTPVDCFMYLRPSLDECMRRLRNRDRAEERTAVDLNYQQLLLHYHDALFCKSSELLPHDNVLELRTDEDFVSHSPEASSVRERIVGLVMEKYQTYCLSAIL